LLNSRSHTKMETSGPLSRMMRMDCLPWMALEQTISGGCCPATFPDWVRATSTDHILSRRPDCVAGVGGLELANVVLKTSI
jgi:hypothetical protein